MNIVGGFGLDFCCGCGLGRSGFIGETDQWCSSDQVMWTCNYTRRKRFRKYLLRANRNQSANTIPPETWEYLMKSAPYSGPLAIYNKLKAGKGIKRKCYDCLPFLCQHLCDGIEVPRLSQAEIATALAYFDKIDRHIERSGDRMVSYIFCLEFILKKMGRFDMLPYVSKIKCPTRRRDYEKQLRNILADEKNNIMHLLTRGE